MKTGEWARDFSIVIFAESPKFEILTYAESQCKHGKIQMEIAMVMESSWMVCIW